MRLTSHLLILESLLEAAARAEGLKRSIAWVSEREWGAVSGAGSDRYIVGLEDVGIGSGQGPSTTGSRSRDKSASTSASWSSTAQEASTAPQGSSHGSAAGGESARQYEEGLSL